jgi:AcrR family transcriptional regulator
MVPRRTVPTADRPIERSSRKAKETRDRLIAAAGVVFGSMGFLEARVTDIVREARVAHGTFYTYFSSKDEIFQEAARRTVDDLFASTSGSHSADEDPVQRIDNANRRYLEAYKRHAPMLAVIEQVGTLTPEFRKIRRELRRTFIERAELSIRRLQDRGLADPHLDAAYAAYALGSMVDNSAYHWLVIGEPLEEDVLLQTLTRLWTHAIGLHMEGDPQGRVDGGGSLTDS